MAKAIKYESYEQWVIGRISRCRSRMMPTSTLLKIPQYLARIECFEVSKRSDGKPDPDELSQQRRTCEDRLRSLRDSGVLSSINRRWYLREPIGG